MVTIKPVWLNNYALLSAVLCKYISCENHAFCNCLFISVSICSLLTSLKVFQWYISMCLMQMNYLFFWSSQCQRSNWPYKCYSTLMYISTKIKNSILYLFLLALLAGKSVGGKKSLRSWWFVSRVCLSGILYFIFFLKKEKEHNGSYEMPRNICAWKHSLHNDKVTVASACLCFS